jgi:hypothetical protein
MDIGFFEVPSHVSLDWNLPSAGLYQRARRKINCVESPKVTPIRTKLFTKGFSPSTLKAEV